jgi:cellobiose-specific phosphotransferase system component IIC
MNASLYGRYAAASVGLMAIATANGVARELTYAHAVGERAAHLISLAPMTAMFAVYVTAVERRWHLPGRRDAVGIGVMWAAIAAGFELGVGHYADGRSWSELLREYDLSAGRPGGLVLAFTVALPSLVRARRGHVAQPSSIPSASA